MQEIKLLPSSEQDNRYIHQQLRRYNRQFMRDFKDYSFHIKQDGQIVAGIVAGSTMDMLATEFLFVEKSHCGQGLGRPQTGLLNTTAFRRPALERTVSTTLPKICERKKEKPFGFSF